PHGSARQGADIREDVVADVVSRAYSASSPITTTATGHTGHSTSSRLIQPPGSCVSRTDQRPPSSAETDSADSSANTAPPRETHFAYPTGAATITPRGGKRYPSRSSPSTAPARTWSFDVTSAAGIPGSVPVS